MIALYTDYGLDGPYLGQLQAVLHQQAPNVPVINLMADVPVFSAQAAAYLLPAIARPCGPDTLFLCVVDPGVGGERDGIVARMDRRWYVAPDNGLLTIAARQATEVAWWRITWQPERLSATFHGRDWFAPVAAMLARGDTVPGVAIEHPARDSIAWPEDLAEIIYLDHYGNAYTGLRARSLTSDSLITIAGQQLRRARTFGDVPAGNCFWYENSHGLIEIAANQANAAQLLGLNVGSPVLVHS